MRSFFTFTIAVLILTACSQAVPSATSTPLPSLTPTQTQTADATATATAVPELVPDILASAQEIFGKDLVVNPDGSVFDPATNQNIPGLTIKLAEDGKSWEWQRVDGELTLSGGQDDIRLFGNGGLGTDGWKYENGEWVKEVPIIVPDYVENIKIVSNPLEYKRAPVINPDDYPALAKVLMERFLNAELGQFPPESKYVPFSFSTSGFNYHGITKVLYPLVGNPDDLYGMDKRWYFLDSIYKEEGTGRMIGHYFVQQKDGRPGQFFANFGPNPIGVAKDFVGWVQGVDDSWEMPVDFATMEGCLEFVPGDQDYCDERLANREKDLEVYKKWAATGMVPPEISSGKMKVVMQGQHVEKPLGN